VAQCWNQNGPLKSCAGFETHVPPPTAELGSARLAAEAGGGWGCCRLKVILKHRAQEQPLQAHPLGLRNPDCRYSRLAQQTWPALCPRR
jgi:hypothetical protein